MREKGILHEKEQETTNEHNIQTVSINSINFNNKQLKK